MNNDEKNWNKVVEMIDSTTRIQVGKYYSNQINKDLKHLLFTLSRYKFICKLLKYKENVKMLELGC